MSTEFLDQPEEPRRVEESFLSPQLFEDKKLL